MGFYPRSVTGLNYITYPVGPTADGFQITANAVANTKGAYGELIASTPFACNRVLIRVIRTAATAGLQYLIDIATGGLGAESVVVADLLSEGTNTATSFGGMSYFDLPLAIPAGTRIAARCQCSTGGSLAFVAITLIAAGDTPGLSSYTTIGAVTADSGATSVDPGAVANTKGSYVELVASSAAIYQVLMLMASLGGNITNTSATWAIDIATGAAGAEVVLIPDLRVSVAVGTTPRAVMTPRGQTLLTYIPAGTRIAVRASCSSNTAGDRLIDLALVLGTAPAEENVVVSIQSPIIRSAWGVAGY